jgi:hypothetical protein
LLCGGREGHAKGRLNRGRFRGADTMNKFAIRHVDRRQSLSVETLGSKPKFWFREGSRRLLFKADDRGTGEDWAEIVACHLCGLIGLPHVEYELASECDAGRSVRPGVVCENMANKPTVLVLGNELLLAIDADYPKEQRFKVRPYTVNVVADVLSQLAAPPAAWLADLPAGVESALDVFVAYVMLDAWIANQDRHHENWGALWDGLVFRLAPTFDHGAAMARNLLDQECHDRLATKDQNRTIVAFAARGRSAFYGEPAAQRPLKLCDAFLAFAQLAPGAARAWLARLATVNQDAVWSILERVPANRMSEICKQFTQKLLMINQQRLLERETTI